MSQLRVSAQESSLCIWWDLEMSMEHLGVKKGLVLSCSLTAGCQALDSVWLHLSLCTRPCLHSQKTSSGPLPHAHPHKLFLFRYFQRSLTCSSAKTPFCGTGLLPRTPCRGQEGLWRSSPISKLKGSVRLIRVVQMQNKMATASLQTSVRWSRNKPRAA